MNDFSPFHFEFTKRVLKYPCPPPEVSETLDDGEEIAKSTTCFSKLKYEPVQDNTAPVKNIFNVHHEILPIANNFLDFSPLSRVAPPPCGYSDGSRAPIFANSRWVEGKYHPIGRRRTRIRFKKSDPPIPVLEPEMALFSLGVDSTVQNTIESEVRRANIPALAQASHDAIAKCVGAVDSVAAHIHTSLDALVTPYANLAQSVSSVSKKIESKLETTGDLSVDQWVVWAALEGIRLARNHEAVDIALFGAQFLNLSGYKLPFSMSSILKLLPKQQNQGTLEPEMESLSLDNVSSILGCVGLASVVMATGRLPEVSRSESIVKKALESAKAITTLERGVGSASKLASVIASFTEWLFRCIFGQDYPFVAALSGKEDILKWLDDIERLCNLEFLPILVSSTELQDEVMKLNDKRVAHERFIVDPRNQISPAVQIHFLSRVKLLTDAVATLRKGNKNLGNRMEPFCIWMCGAPGIGKTTLTTPIIDALLDLEDCPIEGRLFTKNALDEYWTDYFGQPAVSMQDPFSFTETDHKTAREFQSLIQNSRCPLVCAAIPDKGRLFTSRIVYVSDNSSHPRIHGCADVTSIYRRRHVVIGARKVADVLSYDMNHLRFDFIDPVKAQAGAFLPDLVDLTYGEMMAVLSEKYLSHRRKEQGILDAIATRTLGSLDPSRVLPLNPEMLGVDLPQPPPEIVDTETVVENGIDVIRECFYPRQPGSLIEAALSSDPNDPGVAQAVFEGSLSERFYDCEPCLPDVTPLPAMDPEPINLNTSPKRPWSAIGFDCAVAAARGYVDLASIGLDQVVDEVSDALRSQPSVVVPSRKIYLDRGTLLTFIIDVEQARALVDEHRVSPRMATTAYALTRLYASCSSSFIIRRVLESPDTFVIKAVDCGPSGNAMARHLVHVGLARYGVQFVDFLFGLIVTSNVGGGASALLATDVSGDNALLADAVLTARQAFERKHPYLHKMLRIAETISALVGAYYAVKTCGWALSKVMSFISRMVSVPLQWLGLVGPDELDKEAYVCSGQVGLPKAPRKLVKVKGSNVIRLQTQSEKRRSLYQRFKAILHAVPYETEIVKRICGNVKYNVVSMDPQMFPSKGCGEKEYGEALDRFEKFLKDMEAPDDFIKIFLARAKVKQEFMFPQVSEDPNAEDIIAHRVRPNLVRLKAEGVGSLNGFCVKGTCVLTVAHFFSNMKEDQIITMTRPVGTYHKFRFDPKNLFLVENKDLALYRVGPSVPSARDSTGLFIAEKELEFNKLLPAVLVVPSWGGDFPEFNYIQTRAEQMCSNNMASVNFSGGEVLFSEGWKYPSTTTKGDCGSILVGCKNRLQGKLLGLHSAGGSVSMAQLVTSDMVKRLLDAAEMLEPELLPASEPLPDMDEDLDKARVVPTGNFTYFGVVKRGNHLPTKTKIRPSLIHGVVPIVNGPAVLRPSDPRVSVDVAGRSPIQSAVEKCAIPTEPFSLSDMRVTIDHVKCITKNWNNSGDLRRVLTDDEAINGIPAVEFMDAIEMSTSSGFPYVQRKPSGSAGKYWLFDNLGSDFEPKWVVSDPELARRMHDREANAKKGIQSITIITECSKDELRPLEKIESANTRCVSVLPLDYTIVCRKYTLAWASAMNNSRVDSFSAVGTDVDSLDWTHLWNRLLSNSQYGVGGDYTKWDGKVSALFLDAAADVISDWYDDGPCNRLVRRVLFRDVAHAHEMVANLIYMKHQGLPSGFPLTANVNSVINYMYLAVAWRNLVGPEFRSLSCFDDNVKIVVYGDDNLLSIKPKFLELYNHITIAQFFQTYGIVYTTADKTEIKQPYHELLELSFLKRRAVRHKTLRHFFHCPLERSAAESQLNWIRESPSDVDATRENVLGSLRELYHHGYMVFMEVRDRVLRRMKDAGIEPVAISYEELDEHFASKRL